jgi:hypothetical protein
MIRIVLRTLGGFASLGFVAAMLALAAQARPLV